VPHFGGPGPPKIGGTQNRLFSNKGFTLPVFWQNQRFCLQNRTNFANFRRSEKIDLFSEIGDRHKLFGKKGAFSVESKNRFFQFSRSGKSQILQIKKLNFFDSFVWKVVTGMRYRTLVNFVPKFDSGHGESLLVCLIGRFRFLDLNSVPDPRKFFVPKNLTRATVNQWTEIDQGGGFSILANRSRCRQEIFSAGKKFLQIRPGSRNSAVGPEKLLRNFSSPALRLELLNPYGKSPRDLRLATSF